MSFLPGLIGAIAFGRSENKGQFLLGSAIALAGGLTGQPGLVLAGAHISIGSLKSKDSPAGTLAVRQRGVLVQNRGADSPIPVVYGSVRLGVIMGDLAVDTGSPNNADLYIPTVVCHGSRNTIEIASIGAIYFGGVEAVNSGGTQQSPYTASNLFFVKYTGTAVQNIADETIDGTDLDTVFTEWDKTTDDGKGLAGVLFKLVYDIDVFPSNVPVITMDVKGNFVEDNRSEVSGVNISFQDADPDTITRASGDFVADGYVAGDRVQVLGSAANDGNHKIASVAATVLTLESAATLTAAGAAADITLNRWAHPDNGGDNPALCIRDFLLSTVYGAGIAASLIDETSFNAMANYYDETVSTPDGNVSRFTCNGWLDTGRTVPENIADILSSCRGNLVFEGGVYRLFTTRAVTASSLTISVDNIIEDWSWRTPGIDQRVNVINATMVDPDRNYQPHVVRWPISGATNYFRSQDNGFVRERNIDLPMTQNVYVAEQIALTELKETRFGITVECTCTEELFQAQIGDVVSLTHSDPNWVAKKFWVVGMWLLPGSQVRLSLYEYETAVSGINFTFADADPDTIVRASGSWIDDGFRAFDPIEVADSASNDGTYTTEIVTALTITLVSGDALAAEGPSGGITVRTSIYAHDSQTAETASTAANLPTDSTDQQSTTNDVGHGGTGVQDPTSGVLLLAAGSSPFTELAPGAADGVVVSDGAAWTRASTLPDGSVAESNVTQHEAALAILSSQVTMSVLATPAFTTVQHVQDVFHSSGWLSGGAVTDAGGGDIDVAAGEGLIRATDSPTVDLKFMDWSQSLANTVPDGTVRYFGIEYNAGTPQVVVKTTLDFDSNTDFLLGSVVREGAVVHISNQIHAVGDHANSMILRLFDVAKFQRDNTTGGLIISESADTNRYVVVSASNVWSKLNKTAFAAFDSDPAGGADTFDTYAHVASVFTLTTGATQWPNEQYDNGTALVTMTNNRYANLWFYGEPDGEVVMLYGTAQYTSAAGAENESPPSSIPLRVQEHSFLIGRLIFKKSATTAIEVQSVFDITFTAAQSADHGNLTGLADDDHTQYILVDGTRAFTGDVRLNGGTQDYNIGHSGNNLGFSGLSAGTPAAFDVFTNDGDGTDAVYFNIYGVGTLGSITNRERLRLGFDTSRGVVTTEANGTGTIRPLVIFTEGNADQILLGVDGSVTMSGLLSIDDTTDTTSTISGSFHTDGGMACALNLWVGVDARIVGALTIQGADNPIFTMKSSGSDTDCSIKLVQSNDVGVHLVYDGGLDDYIIKSDSGAVFLTIDRSGDAGTVTIASLAGTGTRNVVVDANGVLSAP